MSANAHALTELRRLLGTDNATRGRVVRVLQGSVEVATARGLIQGVSPDPLRVGQQVIISGGVVRQEARAGVVYAL